MTMLQILLQFIFRTIFGVALAMTVTSPGVVTSGFYRVHLWVLMGASVFASLILFSGQAMPALAVYKYRCPDCQHAFEVGVPVDEPLTCPECQGSKLVRLFSPPMTWLLKFLVPGLAIASYLGSVAWLYERPRIGQAFLVAITVGGLLAACCGQAWQPGVPLLATILRAADLLTAGLLLGCVLTAMLLGHWYLNTPSMHLAPLKRLLMILLVVLALRILVCGSGLVLAAEKADSWGLRTWSLISFRWIAGFIGTSVFSLMTWQTLKIPNTQSATGILYAAVVLTFLGELVSQLLGVDMHYPL